jgi:hypothetical protein
MSFASVGLITSIGILLILALLALTAYCAWKEHLRAMHEDEDIIDHPLAHAHLRHR